MTIITADDILRVTREIVAADPDRSNNGHCTYVIDDEGRTGNAAHRQTARPNCIAAVVLTQLGAPLDYLFDIEGVWINEASADFDNYDVDLGVTSDAVDLLATMQRRADNQKIMTGEWQDCRDSRYAEGMVPWSVVLKAITS